MKTNKLLLFILLVLLPMIAIAHPPKKVTLSYEKETGLLTIAAMHPVKDVNDHYIITLEVMVNGETVKTAEYKSQTSPESQDKTIELPDLATGDEVTVKAACNKFGSKTQSLTIE
jgi:desulfoferrodoxin (superoxide reductase-like protein)